MDGLILGVGRRGVDRVLCTELLVKQLGPWAMD